MIYFKNIFDGREAECSSHAAARREMRSRNTVKSQPPAHNTSVIVMRCTPKAQNTTEGISEILCAGFKHIFRRDHNTSL